MYASGSPGLVTRRVRNTTIDLVEYPLCRRPPAALLAQIADLARSAWWRTIPVAVTRTDPYIGSARSALNKYAEREEGAIMSTALSDAKAVCRRCIEIMTDGSIEDFESVVHPDAVNREAKNESPASRGRGPAAYYASALLLRDAFADLHWDIHDVIAEGDLVALHCTMSAAMPTLSATTERTVGSARRSRPPGSDSRSPRRSGTGSPTERSSSTGPIGTTWAWRCN